MIMIYSLFEDAPILAMHSIKYRMMMSDETTKHCLSYALIKLLPNSDLSQSYQTDCIPITSHGMHLV